MFKEVAKEGSISRAARNLNYVQSNVTMRIKHLEEKIGVPLFYRNGKGVTLNTNGEILLTYARQIIFLMEESIKSVQRNVMKPMGTLKIGSTESTAAVRLPPILTNYYSTYPEVELILETYKTDELIRLVLDRKLEGAFISGEIHHPDLTATLFKKEELTLVCHQPLSCIQDINEMNLLVFSHGCYFRSILEKWMREEGIHPKRILEFSTVEAMIGCVKAGMGIAVIMKEIMKGHDHSLILMSLPPSYSTVSTFFITRKDVFHSAALEKFIEMMSVPNTSEI
ncbi:DNA-binding transcriptional LysR family regulator [Hazenella coriacea]|uniref:DNA-binding transcriptional LysR family regulator n=1 Tax=Hazenella coriacea TaxID=1179467 RepID=A0A4R3L8P2_9BACL|nr:DNA-binding transcriptional LysR family regulator [Hazenella coriacea]